MSCYCDYDQPEFFRSSQHKARKDHRCYECGRKIPPGEVYERSVGKWDGQISSHAVCLGCVTLRSYTESNVPCVCWLYGSMIEDCLGAVKEYAHELPGMLFGFYRILVNNRRSL